SVGNIVTLLTRDFTRLVLVAILIGLPISYYVTGQWLDRFAFRIDLTFWYFLLAGILVLLISWLTVGSQAFRSANIDPKECLRDI
ncbi:MAG: ABC transporter permease, partial [Sinomicrobium sp.]|nr:ABC transporter permease [Sinomicrobium sp.]